MSVGESADATGIPRSTVGRLVLEIEVGCLADGGRAGTRGRGTNGTAVVSQAGALVEAQALADVDPWAVPVDGPAPSHAELSDKARRVLGAALDRLLVTMHDLRPRDLNRTVEVTAKVAALLREPPEEEQSPTSGMTAHELAAGIIERAREIAALEAGGA